LKLFQE